jgi:hypothetical protein
LIPTGSKQPPATSGTATPVNGRGAAAGRGSWLSKQIRYFRLGAGNPAIGLRQNARCDARIRLPIVLRKQLDGYPRGANEFSLQGYVTNDLPAIWVAEIAGCRIVVAAFFAGQIERLIAFNMPNPLTIPFSAENRIVL